MMDVMAPDGGWDSARYFEFTFGSGSIEAAAAGRRHRWDRFTGEYRIDVPGDGGDLVAVFNVDDPGAGQAWMGGVRVEDSAVAARLLQQSYNRFINDSYWFLMPYKWTDPGVNVAYLGERIDEDGAAWEVVQLTFQDDVGLTSRNMYEAFINPETGLMERWSHFTDREDAEPRVQSDWTGWQRFGPIMAATGRPSRSGPGGIFFPGVRIEEEVPPGAFDPPTGGG
jgi:hypothetical protein